MTNLNSPKEADLLSAAFPVAAAIGVFGVLYGAAARPVLGPALAVLSSVLIFSGPAQFTMIALLAAGAGVGAVLGGVATLALRHLPLGALLRPRLAAAGPRRALLSMFFIDETTGLALSRPELADRTIAAAGACSYLAWVLGTLGGVAGASLTAVERLADALFPVLFVGLTVLTTSTRGDGARAFIAGGAASCSFSHGPAPARSPPSA